MLGEELRVPQGHLRGARGAEMACCLPYCRQVHDRGVCNFFFACNGGGKGGEGAVFSLLATKEEAHVALADMT